jgi:hypothetical protein
MWNVGVIIFLWVCHFSPDESRSSISIKLLPKYNNNNINNNNNMSASLGPRGEVHTGFWWGVLRKRDNLEKPSVDGRIILRWIFRKWDGGGAWTGLIRLRIGIGDGHLWVR